jgi:replicative DNA helicase
MNEKFKKLIDQKSAAFESWTRFNDNLNRPWGLYGHDTGIHELNLSIGGFVRSKVTTIGGRSGHGKTGLLMPMFKAGNRVLNNRRAEFLVFSWEMGASYLMDRYISMETGLSSRLLTQASKALDKNTLNIIKKAYQEAENLPVTYQQMSTNIDTVSEIFREFCDNCAEKSKIEGVDIIPVGVIDFINIAQFDSKSGSGGLRTYGIADFMVGLKNLCNETGGCFLPLAQIGRAADSKDLPERADFSDSQSVENNSDNMIAIFRPEYLNISLIRDPESGEDVNANGKMLIRTLKGRDFGIGDKLINCDIKKYRFWSMNMEYDFPYWDLYSDENFWKKLFNLDEAKKEIEISIAGQASLFS